MSEEKLAIREPLLEWAHHAASGRIHGLDWVDAEISEEPGEAEVTTNGVTRFKQIAYGAFLPPVMVDAARQAQQEGRPTLLETILFMTAWPEWVISARRTLWTPLSPVPGLLANLVEAYGIGVEIHQNDVERLARLVARKPSWYPHRGQAQRALRLLADTIDERPRETYAHAQTHGPTPSRPAISQEALACRQVGWWAARAEPGAAPAYRIENGFLRFQPKEGGGYRLINEDVLVGWESEHALSTNLMRMLPAWAVLRLVVLES